jgi:general secretion pathway protein D
MKRFLTVSFLICFSVAQASSQQTPPAQNPPQPPPGKTILQTPFGPVIMDAQSPPPAAQPPVTVTPPAPAVPPAGGQLAQPAPGTPQAPQAPATPADDPLVNFSMTFDNQDIYAVIRLIFDQLGLNYVIDPSIKGNVNIHTSAGTMRRSEVLQILETVLRINGATMLRTGNFYQIVPANTAIRQPLPIQERSAVVPFDDQMVIQVVRMRFVTAGEMARLLTNYVSEGGNIVAHDTGNILLISERRSNLRKLLEIVDIFDTNAFEGERVRMYPVKNNFARDLIGDLRTIFAGYAFSADATAIRFVPIERMNSVLVITPNATVFPEVEKWLERLDQPIATAGLRTYVYKVKNSKAADIQRVIGELYASRAQVPPGAGPATPGQPPAVAPPVTPFSTGGPGAPQPPTSATPLVAQSGSVRIIADELNNALVIQTTPQLYADIERTLAELDVLRRQVLIDVQIFEVVLDDSIFLGLNAILQNRGTLINPQTTASFITPTGGSPSLIGSTFAFIGRSRELQVFLNASENRSRVRTLSAPSVLVSDNVTADFQVGAEVPIPTSSGVASGVQQGGNSVFTQTISFRPTGVLLRVKPQINASGNVTLEIMQEVSQAGTNTTSGVVAPVIGKSAINSTIVVQDGQTIALGGFIRENNELARSRIPLLGRIPIAGVLFGNTRRAAGRTELIVLLTPHVLHTHEDADLATSELKAKLKEVQKLLQ